MVEFGGTAWWRTTHGELKWVITYNPSDFSGLTLLIPLIIGVITHLLSGMSHQVLMDMRVSVMVKGWILSRHVVTMVSSVVC